MGGVAKEETLDSTLAESVRLRTPWLLINLVTAFIASMTVRAFESTIAQVVALSAVMSIVTGMGGNAGTQTVSIIIRNIAMGKIKLKRCKRYVIKAECLRIYRRLNSRSNNRLRSWTYLQKSILGNNHLFSNNRKLDNSRNIWIIDSINTGQNKNGSSIIIINILNSNNRYIRIFSIFRISKIIPTTLNIKKIELFNSSIFYLPSKYCF